MNKIHKSIKQRLSGKLEQLTPEQKSLIPIIRDKWIDIALGGKTELKYSKELQDGINWIYQKANQKNTNPLIIIVQSPLAAQLIANLLNNISPDSQNQKLGTNITSKINADCYVAFYHTANGRVIHFKRDIYNNTNRNSDTVFNNFITDARIAIANSVAKDILENVADKIDFDSRSHLVDIHRELTSHISQQISALNSLSSCWENVRNIARLTVTNASTVSVPASNYVGNTIVKLNQFIFNNVVIHAGVSVYSKTWNEIESHVKLDKIDKFDELNFLDDLCERASYLDYFDTIGVLKDKEFEKFRDLLSLGIWSGILFENVAILSKTPSKVVQEGKKLHSVLGPVIQFRDGYSIYRIHEVNFDEKTFYDLTQKKIPVKDILQFRNIEQRYIALEYYGFENILDELNARLIDESPRGNKLYEIDFARRIGNVVTTKFLKYSCPSTEKNYGSFVKPEITRADQAMAWKHNCTEQEYEVLKLEA